ncbi:hypothetical protein DPMN_015328 [Dreissena polymorpha]|uniref:Uncharacterized protein n=1 Tax=Dreissena polymorpha TaxID=45954 RepID=A0A9D4NBA6_DREPO|nr:hypothetical protein DPMN_015328 [Dreissena polymorpha]
MLPCLLCGPLAAPLHTWFHGWAWWAPSTTHVQPPFSSAWVQTLLIWQASSAPAWYTPDHRFILDQSGDVHMVAD